MQGQINLDSVAGKCIEKIASQKDINTIVEIGTWNGLGSTVCVLSGINGRDDVNFISLESDKSMYDSAKSKNLDKNVRIIFGRIVDKKDLDTDNLQHQEKSWLEGDLKNYDECPNVLHLIPNKIDFLILDGGEFSTQQEFKLLKDKSRYIFLDDTRIRKNNKNREDLIDSKDFETIEDHYGDRNGWAIFKRV